MRQLAISILLFVSFTAFAQDFKPYKLTGSWSFQNARTGQGYGGAVEVSADSIDDKGIVKGMISYDGRQLNDRCTTKPAFTDKPVPVEITKLPTGMRLDFQLECAIGPSPKLFSQNYTCSAQGVCTSPMGNSNGSGAVTLTEKR